VSTTTPRRQPSTLLVRGHCSCRPRGPAERGSPVPRVGDRLSATACCGERAIRRSPAVIARRPTRLSEPWQRHSDAGAAARTRAILARQDAHAWEHAPIGSGHLSSRVDGRCARGYSGGREASRLDSAQKANGLPGKAVRARLSAGEHDGVLRGSSGWYLFRVAPSRDDDLIGDRRDASARVLRRHPCRRKTRPDDRRARGIARTRKTPSQGRTHRRKLQAETAGRTNRRPRRRAVATRLPNSFHAPLASSPSERAASGKPSVCRQFARALCRTRTDDPFLTMEQGTSLA
jgi:hypothetical protein